MRNPSVNVVVFLLLSLLNHSQAGFFGGIIDKINNNNNNNKRLTSKPRRRLTDEPLEHVDVDAATGTVKGEVQDPKDTSCDGQLAQALVAANDAEMQAKTERDEALKEKMAALEKIVELESKVESLKGNMGDLQSRQEAEIKALKARLAEAAAETVAAVSAAEKVKDDVIAKLKAQLGVAKGDVEKQMEAQLEEMKVKMERQQKEAEEILEATRQEAKRVLVEKVASVKEQMKEAESQAKAAISKKDSIIKDIKAQNERFSKYNEEMVTAKQEFEKELENWRNAFAKRSYCNMTYIAEDMYETTLTAYSRAAEAASAGASKAVEAATVAAQQLNIHSRKLAKEASVHAQYWYKKAIEIYGEQYNQHWPKIKPHYDEHVAPLVGKVNQWKSKEVDPKLESLKKEYVKIKTNEIDPRLKVLNTERKKLFAKMVELYSTYCSESYKFSRQMAKKHDFMEQFQQVGPYVKDSCDHAERSVTLLLQGMLVLFLLPFTGRILRLAWGLVRLALKVFLTVTLLRFILPRGSSKGKDQPVPYKYKSKSNARFSANTKKGSQRTQ
mmetsp:Transcript_52724/g.147974  ORF Transcript_52724/g.147974 Transcript_52724/m.147974 type:complete len:556 (+) Transcript_52724:103-1770(+)